MMKKITLSASQSERRAFIETALSVAEDFSDGAFWGYMQEMGIEAEEIPSWDEDQKRNVWPDEAAP